MNKIVVNKIWFIVIYIVIFVRNNLIKDVKNYWNFKFLI